MTLRLEKLDTKIEKLLQRREKIQQDYREALLKLMLNSLEKGPPIQTLAGILLQAEDLMKEFPHKQEVWQEAGRKFLSRSFTRKTAKDPCPNQAFSSPQNLRLEKEENGCHEFP